MKIKKSYFNIDTIRDINQIVKDFTPFKKEILG